MSVAAAGAAAVDAADAQSRTSVVSGQHTGRQAAALNPPSLDSVLCHPGSNAAFSIFVQEHSNASCPSQGGDMPGVGHSLDDAPNPELHNNGIPGMRIGSGLAGCIDVKFYLQTHRFEMMHQKAAAGAGLSASAAVAPLSPASSSAAAAASSSPSAASSILSLRRCQVELARSILDRFLIHPAAPPPPSSPMSPEAHRHAYPPLHILVTAERLHALRERIESAEDALNIPLKTPLPHTPSSLLLPSDLFSAEAAAVYAYLDAHLFPLFLNTLACDHLEIEALLLGGSDTSEVGGSNPAGDLALKRFIKSAHNAYREEYPLFYLAYESVRKEVEKGPPLGGGEEESNVGTATAAAAAASTAAAASSSSSSSAASASAASAADSSAAPSSVAAASTKSPEVVWFDAVIRSIEAMYRTFLRGRAEYAIYVEDEVRQQVSDALRLSKKQGVLDYGLLHALLAIKDYTVEVMKYDVMPQYLADLARNHVTERRASLVAGAIDAQKGLRDQHASIAKAAAVAAAEADAPTLIPILKAPLPPPLPLPTAHDANHAAPSPASSVSGHSATGAAVGDEWTPPPPGPPPARRASIVNAAVDVPLGARRSSSINNNKALARGRPGSNSGSGSGSAGGPPPLAGGSAPPPLPAAAAGGGGLAAAVMSGSERPGASSSSSSSAAPGSPHSDEDDLNGSGGGGGGGARAAAPSANAQVRSMAELRHRRSIILSAAPGSGTEGAALRASLSMPAPAPALAPAASATVASSKIPLGPPPPPPPPPDSESDNDDDDEASEKKTVYASPALFANAQAFESFTQSAEALMRNPQLAAPGSPESTSTSSSSAAVPPPLPAALAVPAFSALRRRSVMGGSIVGGHPRPANGSAASDTAAASGSPAASAPVDPSVSEFDPDRGVRFLVPVVGAPPPSARDQELAAKPPPLEGTVIHLPNLAKKAGRSIMKAKIRSETIQEVLKRVFAERVHESAVHLPGLQKGCMILKYNAAGKAAERWFKVSLDGTELCWGKVDEKTKLPLKASLFNRKKRFPLADVTRLRYGASASARFAKYNLSAKSQPWVAFSVHFPDKVLDLVCTGPNAERDVARWFSGVQALAPLSTAYLSGAGLIWRRAQLKIKYYAMWQNITPALFLEDLVAAARQDVPHGRMPQTPVVYLLDKQIAATPEEGQAKEKGKK